MHATTIISDPLSSGVTINRVSYGNPVTVRGTINVNDGYGIIYWGGTGITRTIVNQRMIRALRHQRCIGHQRHDASRRRCQTSPWFDRHAGRIIQAVRSRNSDGLCANASAPACSSSDRLP